jgi:hypothetical protein
MYQISCYFCVSFIHINAGFPHHLPGIPTSQAHLTGTPDWRVLNNRPFPPSQYFHHHPHFAASHNVLAAIDRMERPFSENSKRTENWINVTIASSFEFIYIFCFNPFQTHPSPVKKGCRQVQVVQRVVHPILIRN